MPPRETCSSNKEQKQKHALDVADAILASFAEAFEKDVATEGKKESMKLCVTNVDVERSCIQEDNGQVDQWQLIRSKLGVPRETAADPQNCILFYCDLSSGIIKSSWYILKQDPRRIFHIKIDIKAFTIVLFNHYFIHYRVWDSTNMYVIETNRHSICNVLYKQCMFLNHRIYMHPLVFKQDSISGMFYLAFSADNVLLKTIRVLNKLASLGHFMKQGGAPNKVCKAHIIDRFSTATFSWSFSDDNTLCFSLQWESCDSDHGKTFETSCVFHFDTCIWEYVRGCAEHDDTENNNRRCFNVYGYIFNTLFRPPKFQFMQPFWPESVDVAETE
jgi:hypothetical protein